MPVYKVTVGQMCHVVVMALADTADAASDAVMAYWDRDAESLVAGGHLGVAVFETAGDHPAVVVGVEEVLPRTEDSLRSVG